MPQAVVRPRRQERPATARTHGAPARSSRRLTLWALGLGGLVCLSLAQQYGGSLNDDVAWFLFLAEEVLGGADLHRDFMEINPPLALYLYAVPVIVGSLFGASPAMVFPVVGVLVCLASLWLTAPFVRRLFPDIEVDRGRMFLLIIAAVFLIVPVGAFGQREHMTLVLTLPYLLGIPVAARGDPSGPAVQRLAAAALAAIGFALKPHFLPVLLLAELWVGIRRGWKTLRRGVEWIAICSIFAGYSIWLLIMERDYLGTVRQLLPLYERYPQDPSLPWIAVEVCFLGLATMVVLIRHGKRSHGVGELWFLWSAAGLFGIAAIEQAKGFAYHWIPALGISIVLLAALLLFGGGYLRRSVRVLCLLLMVEVLSIHVGLTAAEAIQGDRRNRGPITRWSEFIGESGGEGGLLLLSPDLILGFPMVNYSGADWISPFPSLWFIGPLADAGALDGQQSGPPYRGGELWELGQRLRSRVVEKAVDHEPHLIVVDQRPGQDYLREPIDLLEYFSRDARFRTLLLEYREIPEPALQVLVLKRRVAAGPAPSESRPVVR